MRHEGLYATRITRQETQQNAETQQLNPWFRSRISEKLNEYNVRIVQNYTPEQYSNDGQQIKEWKDYFYDFAKMQLCTMLLEGDIVEKAVFRARVKEQFMKFFITSREYRELEGTLVNEVCDEAWRTIDAYNTGRGDELYDAAEEM